MAALCFWIRLFPCRHGLLWSAVGFSPGFGYLATAIVALELKQAT